MNICYSIADQTFQHSKSIGILKVSLGLLKGLADQPDIKKIVVLANSKSPLPGNDSAKLSTINCNLPARGKLGRIIWDQWLLYRLAQKSACDWIFLPKGFSSFLFKPPVKLATYVHDAMQDFYQSRYPGSFSRGENWYFNASLKATLLQSARIFTNSDFTRNEVIRIAKSLEITPPPIITAGIGFSQPSSPSIAKREQITVLISRWPHKLTSQALDFVSRWRQDTSYGGQIHWVGDLPAALRLPSLPNSTHSRRVPDAEYDALVASSRALVYFSEYEGFGMPPIESILLGTAPVYSSIPAMRESGLGFGFPFANESFQSFVSAINHAIQCPQDAVQNWAVELLKHHNWENVAVRIVRELKHAGNKGTQGGPVSM